MEELKITLSNEQVYDLELLFHNISVDTKADKCQGMTFSKAYAMAIADMCRILNVSFEDEEFHVNKN